MIHKCLEEKCLLHGLTAFYLLKSISYHVSGVVLADGAVDITPD